jgi:hypothetical protein
MRNEVAALVIVLLVISAATGYLVGVTTKRTASITNSTTMTTSTISSTTITTTKSVGCENQSGGSITFGQLYERPATLSWNISNGYGVFALNGYSSYEDIPFNLTYTAGGVADMYLLDYNAPANTWIGFLPGRLLNNVGPGGTNGTIRIGGAEIVSATNPDATLVQIKATLTDGVVIAQCTIAISRDFNGISIVSSLQRPSIWFPIMTDTSTSPSFNPFGAVYNTSQPSPQQQSLNRTLSVSFSVLGLAQNGTIEPLPPWLNVTIMEPSLLLNASKPAWDGIGVLTRNAPLGAYTVVVSETFNGQYSTVENLDVTVVTPSVIF